MPKDATWFPKNHSKTALENNEDKTQSKSAPCGQSNSQNTQVKLSWPDCHLQMWLTKWPRPKHSKISIRSYSH